MGETAGKNAPEVVIALAREGADSVFDYIMRTAEQVATGVRWRTLDYENELYYDGCVFNGTGGIPFFLASYFALTGDERALTLGIGGAEWCSTPGCSYLGDSGAPYSLLVGRAGVGMTWLRLAEVSEDSRLVERAIRLTAPMVERSLGPVTDYLSGVAGEGIFLTRLWHATGDQAHLAGARRCAQWLDANAVRDDVGCHWPVEIGGRRRHSSWGFAHGAAGIGFFFLVFHEATGEARWADVAREVAVTLSGQAKPEGRSVNWPAVLGASDTPACQWCHGAPGVGLFLAKASEVLGDGSFRALALAAGDTTFARGDVRRNPSQCHGLSGNAELFVELHRLTGDTLWLERGFDFAGLAMAYRVASPEGDAWQADEPGFFSPDYLCGAAGVGHYFLRLLDTPRTRMPLV